MKITKVKEGVVYKTKFNGELLVLERHRNDKVLVKFTDRFGFETITRESHILEGNVRNPYHPRVYGVGYTGEGIYSKTTHELIYKMWSRMLERCYSDKWHVKKPSYIECTVHEKWHNLQNFAEWFTKQKYCGVGYELDKDLLIKGNKVYGSDTCLLIPRKINSTINVANSSNTTGFVGVIRHFGKYQSNITVNGKTRTLGTFNTPEEASAAYVKVKEQYVKDIAISKKEAICKKTFDALMKWSVY